MLSWRNTSLLHCSQLDLLFLYRSVATQPENNSRLQALLKKYGKAGFIVWVVVSILVLFACYAAIEMGVDTVCLDVADLYLDTFTKISTFDMQELADSSFTCYNVLTDVSFVFVISFAEVINARMGLGRLGHSRRRGQAHDGTGASKATLAFESRTNGIIHAGSGVLHAC
jgi:hypothetical protein